MTPSVVFLIATLGAAFVALAVTVAVWAEAHADVRAVRRAGIVNGRRAVARRALIAETIRIAVVVALGGAAGSAAWASTHQGPQAAPWILVSLALFLLSSVLLAVDAVLALRFRRGLTRSHRPNA